MSITCYELLSVSRDADQPTIKAAYKKLALQYHPDKNPGNPQAEEIFKLINNAYQILSDPAQRAQYDLMLNYQEFSTSSTYSHGSDYATSYGTNFRPKAENQGKRSRYDSAEKDEKVARIWVSFFLLFLVMAMVAYGFIDAYLEEKQQRDMVEAKMAVLGKAISHFKQDNYRASLEELENILAEQPADKEIRLFQDEVMKKLYSQTDITYSQANYRKALEYILILLDYDKMPSLNLRYQQVNCYAQLNRHEEAITILEKMVENDSHDLRAYYEMGLIYQYHLKNLRLAEEKLNKAANLVISIYREKYGDAFAMLVDPAKTPPIQFEIFSARANVRFALGNYQDALRDCSWAIFLREKEPDIHFLKGLTFLKLNNREKACQSLREAYRLGSAQALEQMIESCQ